jgi:hypothetical protein
MLWILIKPLAAAAAVLALYAWVLTRVAHGGKGWPRLRRKRNRRNARSRQGRFSPDPTGKDVDELDRRPLRTTQ